MSLKPLLTLLATAVMLLSGCTSSSSPVSPEEMSSYAATMAPFADRELEILMAYDNVTGVNYKDDRTTFEGLKKLLPDAYAFVADIKKIKITDEDLIRVHTFYVRAWEYQYLGMAKTFSALSKADKKLLAEADADLTEGRAYMSKYAREMGALTNPESQ
jgi:hypothetical protein